MTLTESDSRDSTISGSSRLNDRLNGLAKKIDAISSLPIKTPNGTVLGDIIFPSQAMATVVALDLAPNIWHLYLIAGRFDLTDNAQSTKLSDKIASLERIPHYRRNIPDTEIRRQTEIMLETATHLYPLRLKASPTE
jgi:hypothetical protein